MEKPTYRDHYVADGESVPVPPRRERGIEPDAFVYMEWVVVLSILAAAVWLGAGWLIWKLTT